MKILYKKILLFIFFNFFIFHGCSDNDDILLTNNNNHYSLPLETPIRFQVTINTSHPLLNEPEIIESDWGVIILPKTYVHNGLPTPLVIGCHGGGGTVNSTTSQLETMELYLYLVSKGYAVMDMAGMPETFSKRHQIDHNRTVGSFVAIRAYEEGYKFIRNKFNIDTTGVFINGGSNGGLVATNIVLHSNIPVKCQTGMSPLISIQEQTWNLPFGAISGGEFKEYQNRSNIIRIFKMKNANTLEQLKNAVFEPDKVSIWDPLIYLKSLNVNNNYPCPIKIWHPINDPIVNINFSKLFVETINSKKNYAELVSMPGGEHSPEYYGPTIGYFEFNSKSYELKKSVKEVLEWYELYR